ncbi:translocon subunit [Phlyctochytrium planicorne]|nr:translocon subunit [Phlyctochytrium planicorne]
MAPVRLLHVLRPFVSFLPEVASSDRKLPFQDKIFWSLGPLLIYLISLQIPLFGVASTESSDPMYWMRSIMASKRGTILELGLSPLATSAIVLQLLESFNLIEVDRSLKEERALFGGAQKLFALVIAFIQASILVISGVYGDPLEIGAGVSALLIAQLVLATLVISLLDEVLQKGYGLGTAFSLFIGTTVCQSIAWKTFSPISVNTYRGSEYEGAILSFLNLMVSRKDKFLAFKEAVYRPHLPNLAGVVGTALIFGAIIYLQSVRQDIRVNSNRVRGQGGNYPIKLLYTGPMPIFIHATLVSNIYFLSQILFLKFPTNILVRLIGVWSSYDDTPQMFASGGLVYYISPPQSILAVFADPLHFIVYTAFVLTTCSYIAAKWVDISGSSPKDIAKLFHDQQLLIQGYRDSNAKVQLAKIIVPMATLGGLVVGALAVASELLGVGSGVGVVLAVCYIFQFIEIVAQLQQQSPLSAGDFF